MAIDGRTHYALPASCQIIRRPAHCGEKKHIRRGKIRSLGAATKQICERGQLGRVDNRQHFVGRL